MFLFLTNNEFLVRITIFPDLFLPAFHLEKRDKFLTLLNKLRLIKKK